MIAKYTYYLYDLMYDDLTKEALNRAMSTYPLYVSTSKHDYNIPNIVPTREELNEAILSHYKYREIGFETPGRFLDELEIALKEIMPKYNLLYFSADQDYNIIYNVDYKKTIDRDLAGNSSNNSQGSSNTQSQTNDTTTTNSDTESYNKAVKSLTPQGQLNIPNTGIDTLSYADEINWTKDNAENEATTTGNATTNANNTNNTNMTGSNNETEAIVETTKGNFGVVSAQDLVLKFRETIRNITQELINDPRIKELFMLVY